MNKDECAPEAESTSSEEDDSESEKMAEEMIFPAPEARARAEGIMTPVNQLGLLGGAGGGGGRSYGVAASRCLRRFVTIFPPAPERESGTVAMWGKSENLKWNDWNSFVSGFQLFFL